MKILYRCRCFGKKDEKAEVIVPDRIGETDLGAWMDVAGQCIKYHHDFTRPLCVSRKCDVFIPVTDETKPLGSESSHEKEKA